MLASYYYDAFGNIVEQDGNFGNPYRYSGYMYDEESRLYNLNARFYDAKIARFMQEDTYLGSQADPLSLNLYAYCNNNPIRYYDPTGHKAGDVWTDKNGKDYVEQGDGTYRPASSVGGDVWTDKNGNTYVQQGDGTYVPSSYLNTSVDKDGRVTTQLPDGTYLPSYYLYGSESNTPQQKSTSAIIASQIALLTSPANAAQNITTVTVGNKTISNATIINGTAYANAMELGRALGYSVKINNDGSVTLTKGTYTYTTSITEFVNSGEIVAPVRDLAQGAGYGPTLSWWNNSAGGLNVLIQPDMKDAPVRVTRAGDQVNIDAYFNFTGDWNTTPTGYSGPLAELFVTGIKEQWGGTKTATQYDDFGAYSSITVNVNAYAKQASSNGVWVQHDVKKQNYVEVNLNNNIGSANKKDIPHMDASWFGLGNWSYTNPGKITMYTADGRVAYDYSEAEFKATSAHEFGHILGLGDAYETKTSNGTVIHSAAKNTSEVPHGSYFCDPASSIMFNNGTAKANDIEMVLEAFRTNQWQDYVTFTAPFGYQSGTQSVVIRSYK